MDQGIADEPTAGGIVPFVRDVLGCGCPDEVFEQIEQGSLELLPEPAGPTRRIVVGRRLLIYLHELGETADPATLAAVLPALVKAGRAERDRAGLNRVRIVLATGAGDAVAGPAERLFAALAEVDEKVHLHVVQPAELPPS